MRSRLTEEGSTISRGIALTQGYKDIGYLRSDPALISIREERYFQLLLRPPGPLEPNRNPPSVEQLPLNLFFRHRS